MMKKVLQNIFYIILGLAIVANNSVAANNETSAKITQQDIEELLQQLKEICLGELSPQEQASLNALIREHGLNPETIVARKSYTDEPYAFVVPYFVFKIGKPAIYYRIGLDSQFFSANGEIKEEFKAVILHELSHIKHNHGLKLRLARTCGIAAQCALIYYCYKNIDLTTALAAGVLAKPIVALMNVLYTRSCEKEADMDAIARSSTKELEGLSLFFKQANSEMREYWKDKYSYLPYKLFNFFVDPKHPAVEDRIAYTEEAIKQKELGRYGINPNRRSYTIVPQRAH